MEVQWADEQEFIMLVAMFQVNFFASQARLGIFLLGHFNIYSLLKHLPRQFCN